MRAALLLSLWPIAAMGMDDPGRSGAPNAFANPLQAQALRNLTATNTRPLFAPSRRQPPPVAPPPQIAPQQVLPPVPPRVTLVGVLKSQTGVHALLRVAATDKLLHAQIGTEIEGWTVTAIDDRHLRLVHKGRQETVALFKTFVAHPAKGAIPIAYQTQQPPAPAAPPEEAPDSKPTQAAVAPVIHLPSRAQSGRW